MTEIEARDLFGPWHDEDKVTAEKRMAADEMVKILQKQAQADAAKKPVADGFVKALERSQKEIVDHPDHYNSGEVECIDAIQSCMAGLSGFEGFCIGNAIKYLWRWKQKGGVTDLEKAMWYIDRIIKEDADGQG